MLSGRFVGRDGSSGIEVRADVGVEGGTDRISGDLFVQAQGGPPRYRLHFVTPQLGAAVGAIGTGPIDSQIEVDGDEPWQGGRLVAEPLASGALRVELELRQPGVPVERLAADLARLGDRQRALRLRPFLTAGVEGPDSPHLAEVRAPPQPPAATGLRVTFVSALERAGVDLQLEAAQRLADVGGDDAWTDAELIETTALLVAGVSGGDAPGEVWDRPLLVVPRSDRGNLTLGMTFETPEPAFGRASAVFFEAVRAHDKVEDAAGLAREFLFTCMHETAHLLGLPHAWEPLNGVREPERSIDALTFTNYPHLFGYSSFYRRFAYLFRGEELLHLHHGPWREVFPGTAEGHSEIDLLVAPSSTARVESRLELELRSARDGVYRFAEPVVLEVRLANRSSTRVRVPRDALEIEGGRLEVWVEAPGERAARRFAPLVERTRVEPRYTLGRPDHLAGEPSYAIYRTVDLSYGRDGFTFAEPGRYKLRALVLLDDGSVVRAPPLELSVHPPDAADEAAAADLLDAEIGRALALGADPLGRALGRLRTCIERGRPRGLVDAAAYRVATVAAREFKRPLAEEWRLIRADRRAALDLLGRVSEMDRWPNQLRGRMLRLQAECGAALGLPQVAERAVGHLRRQIDRTVRTNLRLRQRLLHDVARLGRRLGVGRAHGP